jgi:4-amino-4-deoxy-L-arabinose transferase-like glycosyltransferase
VAFLLSTKLAEQVESNRATAPRGEPSSSGAATPRRVHPLIWILLLGAAVRLGLWFAWGNWSPLINPDAVDYQRLAVRLVTTGAYANERGMLISLRPPLYPAMVAQIYRAFGLENNDAVRAIQAGLGLLTTVLVYRLGVLAYSRQVGLCAAALHSFYPSLLSYENLLLSEIVFTFLAVAFSWLMVEAICRQGAAWLAAAGVVLGLAALTRSIMLPFLPLVALYVAACWNGTWVRRTLAAVIPVVAFGLIVAPWAIRNTRLQKTLVLIDVMGGRNAMMGNYQYTPLERSWATISDVQGEHAWDSVLRRERQQPGPITQGMIDKHALRHAMRFVLAHPWLTVKRDTVKFFNFWQLERELPASAAAGYFGNLATRWRVLLAAIICGSYAVVLFAALFGFCCSPPGDRRIHWFLILSILFPCLVYSLVFAHSRYHLPVIPLLAIYAAAAVVNSKDIWSRRHAARFATASALCLIFVLGWIREAVVVDLDAIRNIVS